MSKTITIPGADGCRITVVLNGARYIYTAGETATVPDEVAALLEDNAGQNVIYGRSATAPLAPAVPQYDGEDFVPVYTDSKGNMLIRKSDIESGGGGGSMVVTVTYDDEGESYTADKTVAELYAAASAGTDIICHLDMDPGETLVFLLSYFDAGEVHFTRLYKTASDDYIFGNLDTIKVTSDNGTTMERYYWTVDSN